MFFNTEREYLRPILALTTVWNTGETVDMYRHRDGWVVVIMGSSIACSTQKSNRPDLTFWGEKPDVISFPLFNQIGYD